MSVRRCGCGSASTVASSGDLVCCSGSCWGGNNYDIGRCPGNIPDYFCFSGTEGPDKCPGPADVVAYSTQIVVDGECAIPEWKPDAEKLLKAYPCIEIVKAEAVDSQEPKDGRMVKGKKVLVVGFLKLGFEYSDCSPAQKVHFFECQIPFQGLIFGKSNDKDVLLPSNFKLDDYVVHICVEQLQIEQVDCRTFSKVAVLMIWLKPKHKQP